ncbi:MAG: desulfoferrodoxin [Bacteroidales bacterium]|jgi:superoxide reductase|nr:desulfoferrodoxin [Bacteroidales bacterium]
MKKHSPTFWRCNHCGNLAEKLINSGVPMICCGEKMQELVPNTVEASVEKHLPVVEKFDDYALKIEVGSAPHPMTEEHHIAFVYIETEEGGEYIMLNVPDGNPKAEFCICCKGKFVAVYAYCNLHGLWKTAL